jgi:hypothetical protein
MPPPDPEFEIEIVTPDNGAVLDGPRLGQSVEIDVRVTRRVGVGSVRVFVNGRRLQPSGRTSVMFDRPGPASIGARAEAEALGGGGTIEAFASAEVTVLDNPPLDLAVEAPLPGDMPMAEAGQPVAFIAKVTEAPFVEWAGFSLDGWATVNALTRDANDPTRWLAIVPLPGDAPRDYTAEFRCSDFFGRWTAQTVAFRAVDVTPPRFEVSTPPATDGEPVVFAIAREDLPWRHVVVGHAEDTQSGLAEVKWFMSGIPDLQVVEPDAVGNFVFPIERGDYGLYTLRVWVTDRQGNATPLDRQFRIAEAG